MDVRGFLRYDIRTVGLDLCRDGFLFYVHGDDLWVELRSILVIFARDLMDFGFSFDNDGNVFDCHSLTFLIKGRFLGDAFSYFRTVIRQVMDCVDGLSAVVCDVLSYYRWAIWYLGLTDEEVTSEVEVAIARVLDVIGWFRFRFDFPSDVLLINSANLRYNCVIYCQFLNVVGFLRVNYRTIIWDGPFLSVNGSDRVFRDYYVRMVTTYVISNFCIFQGMMFIACFLQLGGATRNVVYSGRYLKDGGRFLNDSIRVEGDVIKRADRRLLTAWCPAVAVAREVVGTAGYRLVTYQDFTVIGSYSVVGSSFFVVCIMCFSHYSIRDISRLSMDFRINRRYINFVLDLFNKDWCSVDVCFYSSDVMDNDLLVILVVD